MHKILYSNNIIKSQKKCKAVAEILLIPDETMRQTN